MKKVKNEENKKAKIIVKEVKRPYMKFLSLISEPIAIACLIVCIYYNYKVMNIRYEFQTMAQEVTADEWEEYEKTTYKYYNTNMKDEKYISVAEFFLRNHDYENLEWVYSGCGSYLEWVCVFLDEYMELVTDYYNNKVSNMIGFDYNTVGLIGVAFIAVRIVSKKSYKNGQTY